MCQCFQAGTQHDVKGFNVFSWINALSVSINWAKTTKDCQLNRCIHQKSLAVISSINFLANNVVHSKCAAPLFHCLGLNSNYLERYCAKYITWKNKQILFQLTQSWPSLLYLPYAPNEVPVLATRIVSICSLAMSQGTRYQMKLQSHLPVLERSGWSEI